MTTDAGAVLIVASEAWTAALPLRDVIETMRPLPVEPLAGAPRFVSGISLIRGAPTPVVDLAMLLGAEVAPSAGRFVTVRAAARQVALAVERVAGVRPLDRERLEALPPLLRGAAAETVDAIATLDAQLLLVIGAARAIPDGLWPAIMGAR